MDSQKALARQLALLEGISDDYNALKVHMMRQQIASLGTIDKATLIDYFMPIFMSNPIYVRDGHINAFIKKTAAPKDIGNLMNQMCPILI